MFLQARNVMGGSIEEVTLYWTLINEQSLSVKVKKYFELGKSENAYLP